MCPMKYLYHIILFLLSNAFLASCADWTAYFDPKEVEVKTSSKQRVRVILSGLSDEIIANIDNRDFIQLKSQHENLATVKNQNEIKFFPLEQSNRSYDAYFDLDGIFLGATNVYVEIKNSKNVIERSTEQLEVLVLRPKRVIDRLFTLSVIVLVSILYINFGAAMNLTTIKEIMRRPVGPSICFFCQFVLMPLAAYGIGYGLFPDSHEMALGLFFTGISPGGGASNMWTLILGGNMNLSIAMTTISTLAAFAMMPFWLFTLGSMIFDRANLGVPYMRITEMALGLLIPLAVGLLIQRFMPRTAKFLVRILKPLSIVLILFIIIFAIITNLYIFQLFSWQIIVAGLGLPLFGYLSGLLASKIFRQTTADAIAIAVETGIQNTGIAIFLLTFSLPQPTADLTTVVPVSVAIMTPFPLLGLFLFQKCRQFRNRKNEKLMPDEAPGLDSDLSSSMP